MPQSTDELRNKITDRFGGIDDGGPTEFLLRAGYELTKEWQWKPKAGVASYNNMTQEEYDCLRFLIEEWDYGGLTTALEVIRRGNSNPIICIPEDRLRLIIGDLVEEAGFERDKASAVQFKHITEDGPKLYLGLAEIAIMVSNEGLADVQSR